MSSNKMLILWKLFLQSFALEFNWEEVGGREAEDGWTHYLIKSFQCKTNNNKTIISKKMLLMS